jgi:hypothetical protein
MDILHVKKCTKYFLVGYLYIRINNSIVNLDEIIYAWYSKNKYIIVVSGKLNLITRARMQFDHLSVDRNGTYSSTECKRNSTQVVFLLVKKYYNVRIELAHCTYSSKLVLVHPRHNLRVAIVEEHFSLSHILKNFNFS